MVREVDQTCASALQDSIWRLRSIQDAQSAMQNLWESEAGLKLALTWIDREDDRIAIMRYLDEKEHRSARRSDGNSA